MIRNSFDVATRVSPRLAGFIENCLENEDLPEPVTLFAVRNHLARMLSPEFREAERLHRFDVGDSLLDELDALIEEFGADAPAADFTSAQASEALSRVIEAVLDDEMRENPPTLGAIREAIAQGLAARLVGDGVLEEEESETLMGEVEALIERFGEDALAEDFIRYE
ncbi:MAG: hypothetical protein N2441_05490 [Rhodocyclaceae bacterium]|nr:hypothetical protein [Rhodocyclaceae bacterium]